MELQIEEVKLYRVQCPCNNWHDVKLEKGEVHCVCGRIIEVDGSKEAVNEMGLSAMEVKTEKDWKWHCKRHAIKYNYGTYEIDESLNLSDMRRDEGHFFQNKHGQRETYDAYRGFLIVRHTNTYSDGIPRRETVIYAFWVDGTGLICRNKLKAHDLRSARKMIDSVIAARQEPVDDQQS